MKNLSDFIHKLEKHETKDVIDNHINGSLTVIWRDYDKIIADYPKMIYVSSVNPGELKGPHLHTKRNSHFICMIPYDWFAFQCIYIELMKALVFCLCCFIAMVGAHQYSTDLNYS